MEKCHNRRLGHHGLLSQKRESLSNESNKSKLSRKLTHQKIAANTILVYILVACSLLSKQISKSAKDFEKKGGFTERLYRVRKDKKSW